MNDENEHTPRVTGLSPAEGSPGTKVTIRGENLGSGQNDLVCVTICGMDCTMFSEWKSRHKIVTRTRICSGTGDVIVTTRSGGKGTCTVQFKGIHETVSPLVESAVWVDESHIFHTSFPSMMKGPTSSSSLSKEINLLGSVAQTPLDPATEALVRSTFVGKSTDVFAGNFSPELYLLHNHFQCDFPTLKTGLKELERRVGAQQEGPSTFLKSNVYGIVKCLDVLKELNRLMNKDRCEMAAPLTESLSKNLTKTSDEAQSIFEVILKRKESADSMRTCLSILHKFRFLFNLPAQIENNVKMGEYDTVIDDYSRARSVFHDTEVAIFKRVLNDVEQKISIFKEKLQQGLRQFPAPLEERKKQIGHLVQLDPERNHAWEAIKYNHEWLLDQMNELKDSYVQKTEQDEGQDPPRVEFVLSLCRFFRKNAPDFFQLQHAYLHREIEGLHMTKNEEETNRSSDMTLKLVSKLCLEVRAALLPTQSLKATIDWPRLKQPIGPWLPNCLRSVRKCYFCVLKLDPPHASASMQSLITDLREHAMMSLIDQAAQDIGKLHELETWRNSSYEGTVGASQLPLLFENRVIEALQVIQENVLQSSANQMFQQANVKAAIKKNVQLMMSSYVDSLEKSPETERNYRETADHRGLLKLEDKLLITLANITVSREQVLPRIQNAFLNQQYPDISEIMANGEQLLSQLYQRILQRVIRLLQRPLIDSVEGLMELYRVEWATQRKPTDVSTYVKELLLELTEMQQRIFKISPSLVQGVLKPIVAALMAEVARLCSSVKTSSKGNSQIFVDILALEDTLKSFNDNKPYEVLRSCKERLANPANKEAIEDVLQLQSRFNQHLQSMCLQ